MISREEILNLAELARIRVSEEEIASLQKDISHILEYVGQVSAVSASSESPEPALARNVMRADEVRGEGDALAGKREALLSALPKREGDYNVVRKIIQKDE
jgi:aspartyl-tRNA(Asn)/glutamyl-tRNA(Gln) amidotransferase subunit C